MRRISYSIKAVQALRKKLEDSVILEFSGTQPTGDYFNRFVTCLHSCLAPKVQYDTMLRTALPYLNTQLTQTTIKQLCWRIAGNLTTLRQGKPALPWFGDNTIEWVPLQIIDSAYTRGVGSKNQDGFTYTFRVMAGSPCPTTISKFWSRKFISYISRKLGFTAPFKRGKRPVYPLKDGSEFLSMRLYGCIDPEISRPREPNFQKLSVPSSCLKWNREVLTARQKVDPKCPLGFTHDCFRCWVGADRCKAGCHPVTFIEKQCDICKKPSLSDPRSAMNVCIQCMRQRNT